ncbi:MAG: DUF4943 family protein [Bacteroidetes bacterium]|nr:DUF4943 family protein [Bacteroidota bacterium]
MKYLIIIATFLSLSFYCCNPGEYAKHQGPDFDEYISVDEYIDYLADNKYDHFFIPILSPDDIPQLLEISQSKIIIDNFPRNPLSSYAQRENRLGFVALWSIESIRKSFGIKDMDKYDRFPSQNSVPVSADSFYQVNDSDSLLDRFADKYKSWWKDNENKEFNKFRFIDPLIGTGYKWK